MVSATGKYVVICVIPARGHVNSALPLALELRERGHEVVFTFFDDDSAVVKEYGFEHISLGPISHFTKKREVEITAVMYKDPAAGLLLGTREILLGLYDQAFTTFNRSFREKRPDLVIVDQTGVPYGDVARILGIPLLILINSLDLFNPAQSDPLMDTVANEKRAKHGVVVPRDLHAIFIVLSVWGLETPRLVPPNMHLVGNMWPLDNTGEWESDTAKWIDNSDKPVLYVSLGSVVQVTDLQLTQFAEGLNLAVQQLGIRVLWILRNDQEGREKIIPNQDGNFRVESWGEQRKILSHKKVFCFLSHGGQNSVSESLANGKPLIVMPFFADQFSNAQNVVNSGSGSKLPAGGFSSKDIVQTIKEVLEKKEHHTKHAEKIAFLMKEAGGAKRAADLAEQTIKVGVSHLILPKEDNNNK